MAGLRQQTCYAPNVFPSPSASNIILSLFVWHSALSVQHIEATDRKRGSWICLEFPFFFLHLTRLPSRLSLKLTIQISLFLSEGSRLWFETWGWEQSCVSYTVFAERQISAVKYLPQRNELVITPLFVVRRIFVLLEIARMRLLKHNWYDTIYVFRDFH